MSTTLDWIKAVPSSLLLKDASERIGYPPEFSIDTFVQQISSALNLKDLSISVGSLGHTSAQSALEGLGDPYHTFSLTAAPIKGSFWWVLPKNDLETFFSILLSGQVTPLSMDQTYFQGFARFLAIEALQAASLACQDKKLSFQLQSHAPFPEEGDVLTLDVFISVADRSFTSRLIFSPQFQASMKEHYSLRSLDAPLNPRLSSQLTVSLSIQAGLIPLSQNEIRSIRPGDFVIMDQPSIQPGEERSRITLTLHGKPLFLGRIRKGRLKITEYPLYHEEIKPMPEPIDEDTPDTQEDLPPQPTEQSVQPPSHSVAPPTPKPVPEATAPSNEFGDEAPDDDTEPLPAITQGQAPVKVSPNEIPINVVVEVGRLEMSIQKLMELKPGVILEVNSCPDNGVDLVVQGRLVAKGELLKIGDIIGVRILDIG